MSRIEISALSICFKLDNNNKPSYSQEKTLLKGLESQILTKGLISLQKYCN